jgi:hypothetical protein
MGSEKHPPNTIKDLEPAHSLPLLMRGIQTSFRRRCSHATIRAMKKTILAVLVLLVFASPVFAATHHHHRRHHHVVHHR